MYLLITFQVYNFSVFGTLFAQLNRKRVTLA